MFFSGPLQQIARRQRQLLDRQAQLRQRLVDDAQALRQPLDLADQVRHGWLWLRSHPQVLLAGVLVFAVVRPRRVWRLAGRAWAGWQLWRRLQRWHSAWLTAGGQASPRAGTQSGNPAGGWTRQIVNPRPPRRPPLR